MNKPDGWDEIKELVSARIGVPQEYFFLKSKKKDTVLARRIFYILCSKTVCRAMSQGAFLPFMGSGWEDRSILSYYEKCHKNDMKVHKEYKKQFKSMLNETQKIYARKFREANKI